MRREIKRIFTVPLRGRDPRNIRVVIRHGRATVGYAIYGERLGGEWRVEGPLDPCEALALAQQLSAVGDLPIVLSTKDGDIPLPPERTH